MGFRNAILGSGGTLVRDAIKSPDYAPGSAGWTINRDGTAEFNSLTVRGVFRGTRSEITQNGIFFYAGPPATSNLVGSWASATGSDPYGHAYDAGITVSDPLSGNYVQLKNGAITLGPDSATAGGMNASGGGLVITSSTGGVTFDDPVRLALSPGMQGQGSNTGLNPSVLIADLYQNSAVDVGVSGAIVKTTLGGGYASWHTPVMGAGFATGPGGAGAYPPLQWRLDAEDNVHIFGAFHTTTTAPGGVIATGFPAVNQTALGGVGAAGGITRFQGAAGSVGGYLNNATELRTAVPTGFVYAVNDSFMINAKIPLGNLA